MPGLAGRCRGGAAWDGCSAAAARAPSCAQAQPTRASRRAKRRRAAAAHPPTIEPADDHVPDSARRWRARPSTSFCDVLTGRDPADGILMTVPPASGPAHADASISTIATRIRRSRSSRSAASLVHRDDWRADAGQHAGVARGRGSEFRTAEDLVDRVGGGAGPAA